MFKKNLTGTISDIHLPWWNKRATMLALFIMKDLGITRLVLNGDIADFYCLNAYGPKHPDVQHNLETELQALQDFLTMCREMFPDIEIIWIFGNHEDRLERDIILKAPAYYNICKLEKQMQLEQLAIKWVPYNCRYQIDSANMFVQHSPPSYSVAGVRPSMIKKIDENHIWGCIHKTSTHTLVGSSGQIYQSFNNGWFGCVGVIQKLQNEMPENKRVFKYTKQHESWDRSFCLTTTFGHNLEEQATEQIVIHYDGFKYFAVVGGMIYEN